jgi:hypothetical protein
MPLCSRLLANQQAKSSKAANKHKEEYNMKYISLFITTIMLLSSGIVAADLMIYPAKGQDNATQQKDEGECFVWARNETGIDPTQQTVAPVAVAQEQQGRGLRGAAGGAAIGAIVGDSDDAAKGAAIGAVVGRSRQNRQNRASADQAQQQNQQSQQMSAQSQAEFNKAYSICLQGRGYTVG